MRRIAYASSGAVAVAILAAGAACGGFRDTRGDDGGPSEGGADAPGADVEAAAPAEGGDAPSEAANGSRPCTAAACPPVVMAGDLHYPVGLAVDATHLYWIEAGNGVSDPYAPLVRILKSAPCLHATDACRGVLDSMAGGDVFTSLALGVGPGQACYTQTYNTPAGHSVNCVAFGAGAGTRGIYQGPGAATQVVVTADTIAWTDFGQAAASANGALFAVPADAGFTADAQAVLSGLPGPSALATDGADLVWAEYGTTADAGSVRRVPLDGGGSTLLAAAQASPAGVATYAGYAYWASVGDGTVRRVKDDGTGPVQTVSSGEIAPVAVYADATGVYWIDAGTGPDYLDGALRRADLAGGNATTMMPGLVNLQAMAVDDVDVYVCNAGTVGGQYHDGTIWQIAKTY